MNELMSDPSTQLDCTSSSRSIAWAPNDVYSQVKGKEHSGRVYGLGFGPTPSGQNTKIVGIWPFWVGPNRRPCGQPIKAKP